MASPPAVTKFVFIVGSARSGTNWLRRLLSQSANVATGPETHLFSSYLQSLAESWRRHDGTHVGLSHLITEDELVEWMRGFAGLCLGRIADNRRGAGIVVEKTPKHGERAADILRLFPKAYFIHIIRDPRAVVPSLRAASRSWGSRWAPGNIRDASRKWRKDVMAIRSIPSLTERYREVRYEDLHANGADEIMRLFEWLGEPVGSEEAAAYVAASAFEKVRPKVASAADVDAQFYRRGEVDSWRRELSGSDIAIIERLTRKQMAEFGYQPVASRRDRMLAGARLQSYRLANKFAKAVRAGADRIKP
ncbi:MAG: sulfotransferase family protein [Rhodoplanes sp.]